MAARVLSLSSRLGAPLQARSGRRLGLALGLALGMAAACSPQDAADSVLRQTAATVVTPMVERFMQPAQAAGVVTCVLDSASSDELRQLALNVGTRGGTVPLNLVLSIAARPQAIQCIAAAGLPMLPSVVL